MRKQVKELDLFIIGAGPAGLAAAIYASRLKLNMLVLEQEIIGGQIQGTSIVENYPGFLRISGEELAERMQEQAISLGVKIEEFDSLSSVILTSEEKIIETQNAIYKPQAVIIATGSAPRLLPVPEEAQFHGNGIHYCALCDGQMYEGKEILLVGGGNSAVEAADFLRRYAKHITLIHQFDRLQANKASQERLFKNKKIQIIWNSEIRRILGEEKVTGVQIENMKTKQITEIKAEGIFVYIGNEPKTDWFKEYIITDQWGYIEAGETTETNVEGVFAAGDVRKKPFRQLTTAVSDGTVAALMAEQYILKKRRKKDA